MHSKPYSMYQFFGTVTYWLSWFQYLFTTILRWEDFGQYPIVIYYYDAWTTKDPSLLANRVLCERTLQMLDIRRSTVLQPNHRLVMLQLCNHNEHGYLPSCDKVKVQRVQTCSIEYTRHSLSLLTWKLKLISWNNQQWYFGLPIQSVWLLQKIKN